MKLRLIPLVLAATVIFQSCLVDDMSAKKNIFEVVDVTVPADTVSAYGKGTGYVTVSVPVRSTESWSAGILDADSAPWLEIVSCDFANPSGADVTEMLELQCAFNDGYSQRSAQLRFVTVSGQTRDINVIQKAKANRISIDGETSYSMDAQTAATVSVKILSNADWTAEVDPSSTGTITSIKPSSGTGDAVVTITPDLNYDCRESTRAVVRFCVADGNPAEVTITRNADTPFIGVNPVDVQQDRLPKDITGVLKFNCNLPWKAEILECGIRNFELDTLAGPGGMNTELPFRMSPNDGDGVRTAKVKISLESDPGKNVVLTVAHLAGFTLEVDFTTLMAGDPCPLQPVDAKYPEIPFSTVNYIDTKGEQYDYKFVSGGKEYVLGIKNSVINWYGNNSGGVPKKDGYIRLSVGYVKYPAVEGYRLAYVEFTTAATDKRYFISADAEGLEIVGAKKTVGKEVKVFWNLQGTEYGKSYYEWIDISNSRQHNLILLYVK